MTRILRFVMVGGGLALFYAISTSAAISAGVPAVPISIAIYLACIPLGFWMQGRFTFRVRSTRRGAMILYTLTQALGLSIVTIATALFITERFWPDMMVLISASVCAAVVSYILSKAVIFRNVV